MKQRASPLAKHLMAIAIPLSLAGMAMLNGHDDAAAAASKETRLPSTRDFKADDGSQESRGRPMLLLPCDSEEAQRFDVQPPDKSHADFAEILMNWDWHQWRP